MDANGDFVISWESYYGDLGDSYYSIHAQRYNALGETQGSEFQVNSYTTGEQKQPAVGMDSDGNFVISWHSYGQDEDYFGVFAQRYNSNGNAQGSEFHVNTYTTMSQTKPAVAMDEDGDFIITWTGHYYTYGGGIFAQRYDSSGNPVGSEFQLNTNFEGEQMDSSVAMDSDGDYIVTWTSNGQDGNGYGIFAGNGL